MAYILCIETSAHNCSVAVFDDSKCVGLREDTSGTYMHSASLHTFIETSLKDAGISVKQLDAIAVSAGPGSYTGLRIGVAAAKGLAFALNIPLLSVDTLTMMASKAISQHAGSDIYIPMIDARRMEVYMAQYDAQGNPISPVEAVVPDEALFQSFKGSIVFCGDGCSKFIQWSQPNMVFDAGLIPSAQWMGEIAFSRWKDQKVEDLAYFEPFYLKYFIPGIGSTV
jgi:tRNA threonylcarbamoyladenosine biosynthesis protein TsaB